MTPIEHASRWLAEADRVAVLTGAGISAESGIPTFRGSGGLWRGRDSMSLATPRAFLNDPGLVWEFYNWRRDLVFKAEPNPGHHAIARLASLVPMLTLITQNVDRLHQRGGSRGVLEIHGNLAEVRCTGCQQIFDRTGVALPPKPLCDHCGSMLRPAVVWFGEGLPESVWSAAVRAVMDADILLVVGTSAVVHPAAGLIRLARDHGHTVIEINLDPTNATEDVDLSIQGRSGEILPGIVDLIPDFSTGRD